MYSQAPLPSSIPHSASEGRDDREVVQRGNDQTMKAQFEFVGEF